jgi:hypothetical protein
MSKDEIERAMDLELRERIDWRYIGERPLFKCNGPVVHAARLLR